ncbi:hypothetical protein HAX54_041286 [Datura stramonium]|uniref:Uncharacterized protein n=1 Tax=Datura stramonium TaxID=4076 RepID=A0ABS8VSD8_DATST|nr:hypothetical protein [Datura stramonium]
MKWEKRAWFNIQTYEIPDPENHESGPYEGCDRSNAIFLGPYKQSLELTHTLEEIATYTGFGKNLHRRKFVAPRNISVNKFLSHLNICKVNEASTNKKGKGLASTCSLIGGDRDHLDLPLVSLEGRIGRKIWGGCQVFGFDTLVKESDREVHPMYPTWFKEQPGLKVQLRDGEGSDRRGINQNEGKQARAQSRRKLSIHSTRSE